MDRRFRRSVLLILAACGLGACALLPTRGPPIQEMSDARQAVQAAGEAGADTHAGLSLKRAREGLERAEDALEGRRYDEARREAIAAKEGAASARRAAVAIRRAYSSIDEAERLGGALGEAPDLLGRAQTRARTGDDAAAVDLADQAQRLAEASLSRRYLELARARLTQIAPQRSRLTPEEQTRYDAAQAAVTAEEGRQAYELAKVLPVRPSTRPARRTAQPAPTPVRQPP